MIGILDTPLISSRMQIEKKTNFDVDKQFWIVKRANFEKLSIFAKTIYFGCFDPE